MLILSRKPSQVILIGADLFLTVGSTNAAGVQLLSNREGEVTTIEVRLQIGYSWQITDNVNIKILESRHGVVKLGIEAPREISIDRLEVRQSKLAKQQAAANRQINHSVRLPH